MMTMASMPLILADSANAVLTTFLLYIVGVFVLAGISNRLLQKKSFLSEYFLGSRSLGVWAFALTFAATSSSGGSFMGFPSKIYTHGWVLALWIGSYMVVPICTMGLLGKRINQVARISGSITIPDVIRDRFHSAKFGLLAITLIVFFMSFNLVAQFKAGSMILKTLLADIDAFQTAADAFAIQTKSLGMLQSSLGADYVLCLLTFGLAVIIYTTYGGFHAVVWTDVMQGVVMVVGVAVMLPLAILQVGGLENATTELAKMTPPHRRYASVVVDNASPQARRFTETWISLPQENGEPPRLFRLVKPVIFPANKRQVHAVEVLEETTPENIQRILAGETAGNIERLLSLRGISTDTERIGTVTITFDQPPETATSLQRGTWVSWKENATQTHVFRIERTVHVEVGTSSVPDVRVLEPTREECVRRVLMGTERQSLRSDLSVSDVQVSAPRPAYGDSQKGVYVTGPGPSPTDPHGFLPLSLAISFFFMWAISGAGQPSNMVRLMAFNSSRTLKRSIFTVAMYYTLIYFPLVIIFTCARILMPGMEGESDRIMPAMAVLLTEHAGVAWLAGLLIAAPFAAVMSTVDSFLLMISSALVRDIYQRNINPEARERTVKRLSYFFTLLVGVIAMFGAVNPPQFLQDIIVYVGSGLAACFLGPMVFALYWPRSNVQGSTAGMLAGFGAHLGMYVAGLFVNGSFFQPYRLLNFDPIIVGLVASFVTTYVVTLLTPLPPQELVARYFHKKA